MGNFPTQESPNYLFNFWTDFTTNPPTLNVGLLQWDGSSWVKQRNNPLAAYQPSDVDNSTISYYGFIRSDGAWYIMQKTTSGSVDSYRYAAGDTDYPTYWATRDCIVYNYYNAVF